MYRQECIRKETIGKKFKNSKVIFGQKIDFLLDQAVGSSFRRKLIDWREKKFNFFFFYQSMGKFRKKDRKLFPEFVRFFYSISSVHNTTVGAIP